MLIIKPYSSTIGFVSQRLNKEKDKKSPLTAVNLSAININWAHVSL